MVGRTAVWLRLKLQFPSYSLLSSTLYTCRYPLPLPGTGAVQTGSPGTPLCSPPSWVTSPASNSPPHRSGHSSPQEQSFSVWPHAARLLPVWAGRTKPLRPSSPGRREGKRRQWRLGERWQDPVPAEATEEPRQGLSAKLKAERPARAFALGQTDQKAKLSAGSAQSPPCPRASCRGTQQWGLPWTT